MYVIQFNDYEWKYYYTICFFSFFNKQNVCLSGLQLALSPRKAK